MTRLAFSLGSELPLHANPTVGGTKPHGPGTGKTWLWCCLALLAVLGLPWCAYAKPEAESSASIDEVVTTIYHLDTLVTMKRQADMQRMRSQLHFTTGQISLKHGKEKAAELHAELAILLDGALAAEEWILARGAEHKAQLKARFVALPVRDRMAIIRCVTPGSRFELQEADLIQARRHPPASEQGAAERRALFQKHFATGEKLTRSACWSPELSKLVSILLAPRMAEQHPEEPPREALNKSLP